MAEPDLLDAGTVIAGKYRLDRVLGRGGMASVYAATHLQLREPVAIKVLNAQLRHRVGTVERFLREARVAMRLRSEHVSRVFDIGTTDEGAPFIVMEMLAGADFATLLHEQGPFTVREAVDYVLQACQALAEAHASGVVHRDLKPANLFLCARVDGTPSVKVLDFGVSKLVLEDAEPDVLSETVPSSDAFHERERAAAEGGARGAAVVGGGQGPSLTMTRTLLGSPAYMAPEQIRSARDVDARADVWALGVVLFELVSGTRPFAGETLDAICACIASRHPAPLTVPGGAPPGLEAAIAVCLAKDPADRYQSVRAFAEAVAPLGTEDARASLERIVRIVEPRAPNANVRSPRVEASPTLESASSSTSVASPARTAGSWRRRPVAGLALVGAVLAAAGSFVAWRARTHVEPVKSGGAIAKCASSRACTASLGAAARCGGDGMCVALASEDCAVHASQAAIDADDTVWLGAMLPLQTFGRPSARSIDLAREDFDQMMASFGASSGASHVRPFGVVTCDDTRDAMRAAKHLVEEVRVPAIIGFESSAKLIDVGGSLLVPNGVLAIASLTTSPLATSLPTAPGQPRLVWRTTYSSAASVKAISRVVPDLLEPQVRAQRGVLPKGAPMRVALFRSKTPTGSTHDSNFAAALRFNGKSVLENGDAFRVIVIDQTEPAKAEAESAAAVSALDAFAPHVVIMMVEESDRILGALEHAWSHPAYRPRFLFMTNLDAPVLAWLGDSAELRHRTFGIAPAATRPPNLSFVLRYNEGATEKTTPALAPSESYDAFYLLAYATYALGDAPATGTNLARAITKLLPPGPSIDVGPAHIYDAYTAIRRGEHIDLNGAVGSLDFDPATGEEPIDQNVVCAGIDAHGRAVDDVESGVTYASAKDALEGTLRCP